MSNTHPSQSVAWIAVSVALMLTSACRVGNRVEHDDSLKRRSEGSPLTGYYEMGLQSLQFCAVIEADEGEPQSRCQPASLQYTPIQPTEVYSNPVILYVPDPNISLIQILSYQERNGQRQGYELSFESNEKTITRMDSSAMASPALLWPAVSEDCAVRVTRSIAGNTTPYPKGGTEKGPRFQDGTPLWGRVNLQHQMIHALLGDCQPVLQIARACMSEPRFCLQATEELNLAEQASWNETFRPYIETGVITIDEVPFVQTLSYELTY